LIEFWIFSEVKPVDHITAGRVRAELEALGNQEKAAFLPGFFKAVPGGYGEGDRFLGVTVPAQRRLAKKYYRGLGLADLAVLLRDPYHEGRLTALFILVNRYEQAVSDAERQTLVDLYLENLDFVNNWDLVDSSADKILGAHLFARDKSLLYDLAAGAHLWRQRVAVIATFYFIRRGFFQDTLEIARILLEHDHDLIHKAVGWMLREIGKRDFAVEFAFLQTHYRQMPRTMLRYAIEQFPPDLRAQFLQGHITPQ
jgi:3-methyladenine DNA glycosylase AlkD